MSQVRQAMLMLINGLKLDISHYSLFISLLKEQQSLMQQHDSDKLIQLNLRHEKLLNSISTQAERRKKIMLGIGVTADDAGMEQILNLLDRISRERVSALWQRLKILTQLCQDQNDINGQLLASQHELLNKILYPENKGNTYHSQLRNIKSVTVKLVSSTTSASVLYNERSRKNV